MAKLKTDLSGKGSNIRNERAYAKSIGVKSPTVLTKAQLDEAVRLRELELGISKEKFNIYDFSPDERKSLYPRITAKTRIQMFTGYFDPFEEGDGVLRRDPYRAIPETDVYVAKELVDEYRMLAGDRVVGNVSVVPYNNVRVLKNVKYVNEEPTSRPVLRKPYDEMTDVPVSGRVEVGGNNALAGIIQDVLCLGHGQSLSVSGYSPVTRGFFEHAAVELIKGLYMRFDGNVFGIFEKVSSDNERLLAPVLNPETVLLDGDRSQYPFMLEMMKRSVERGVNAVAVIYAPDYDAKAFVSAAKAKKDAGLTVIAFTREEIGAQATVVFDGKSVSVGRLNNPLASLVCGTDRHKRIFRALSSMDDAPPDNVLSEFTELMNE